MPDDELPVILVSAADAAAAGALISGYKIFVFHYILCESLVEIELFIIEALLSCWVTFVL